MGNIYTQRDRTKWARAFLGAIGNVRLESEDYTFACVLRDKGLAAEYAAARVKLRIRNRAAA